MSSLQLPELIVRAIIHCMSSSTPDNSSKRGRPTGSGNYNSRLPVVRVSNKNLNSYQIAAIQADLSFSEWLRQTLDKAVELPE